MRFSKTIVVFGIVLLAVGCQTLAKRNGSSGVIVARRAQIRSSTAVVAADLLQVNRGDVVDILDSTDVTDPSDNTRKERWLRVKARDTDATEGWIEARNVMPNDVLEESKKLEAEDKEIPAQATGQLRASSNLRLSPDRSGNENIMMRLDSGSSFDIIGWKRVPKPKSSEAIETDVAPKAGSAQQGSSKAGQQDNDDKEPDDTNELWYKVRLTTATSPAPAGWIYGKQVELAVPSDIIFYRTGREFVAWQRLDGESRDKESGDKDVARESKPGSWLILERSSSNAPHGIDEPDFDRVYVLGYDKRNQEHYTAYRSPDLRGYLPAKVEGQGESKSFTLRIQEEEGGPAKEVRYSLYKDARGVLKVTAPNIQQNRRRR
jgi:hypothetical protein